MALAQQAPNSPDPIASAPDPIASAPDPALSTLGPGSGSDPGPVILPDSDAASPALLALDLTSLIPDPASPV